MRYGAPRIKRNTPTLMSIRIKWWIEKLIGRRKMKDVLFSCFAFRLFWLATSSCNAGLIEPLRLPEHFVSDACKYIYMCVWYPIFVLFPAGAWQRKCFSKLNDKISEIPCQAKKEKKIRKISRTYSRHKSDSLVNKSNHELSQSNILFSFLLSK